MATSAEVGTAFDQMVESAGKLYKIAKVLAWVALALIVLVVVLEVQVQRRNAAIERIEASTKRSEAAALRAEKAGTDARIAAVKASQDLQAAVERGQNPEAAQATNRALQQIAEIHALLVEEQP